MKYFLKLLVVTTFYSCVSTTCTEDLDSLVSTVSANPSSINKPISINIKREEGDSDVEYKKEKINDKDCHIYTAKNTNKITCVYNGNSLVWQGDENHYSKSVYKYKSTFRGGFVVVKLSIDGSEVEKKFVKTGGFYYESGTIALNLKDASSTSSYTVTSTVQNKDGENTYTVKDGNKITLVFFKRQCRNGTLFWKANGDWYCDRVVTTIVSNDLTSVALSTTNGCTKAEVVLVKQDSSTWVPQNTISLNIEKKEKAPNCTYTNEVTGNNGAFTFTPNEGYTFCKVFIKTSLSSEAVFWETCGKYSCTKVTASVESDKIVKITLDLKAGDSLSKLSLVKHADKWVQGNDD